MYVKVVTAAVAVICFASLTWSSASHAQTVLSVTGDARMNSLDGATTLGSAELRFKGQGSETVKLVCGIRGQVLAQTGANSFTFRHTVACADHSVFVLETTALLIAVSMT